VNAITHPASARAELIAEVLYEAICDSNGAPLSHRDLAHHLAKRGLVIVEATKWDTAKTALQVIGSFPVTSPVENMDAANMTRLARSALIRMDA
jgi:hypothetical protein